MEAALIWRVTSMGAKGIEIPTWEQLYTQCMHSQLQAGQGQACARPVERKGIEPSTSALRTLGLAAQA